MSESDTLENMLTNHFHILNRWSVRCRKTASSNEIVIIRNVSQYDHNRTRTLKSLNSWEERVGYQQPALTAKLFDWRWIKSYFLSYLVALSSPNSTQNFQFFFFDIL